MTTDEALKADGWKEYPDSLRPYSRHFYKRFDTPTRCHGNDDKPGMQVEISIGEYDGRVSFELDITGGLADETWLTIKNYALPCDVAQVFELIPRLLHLWESAAAVEAAKKVME